MKWDYGENILKAQCDFLPSNGNQEVKHYSMNSVSSSIDMWQSHVHPNPSSPWSLYSSHLYKRQQARDNNPGVSVNEQQCLMSNCKLHAHVIKNTNKRKRGFGKHACANIFLWMGGCPHEQECRKIDNSLLHVCLNILLFSGSMAVSDKSIIKSCIWGNFKKSTLYTCTLWKIYMIMNINIIQMNTMGGPYQCALKSLEV